MGWLDYLAENHNRIKAKDASKIIEEAVRTGLVSMDEVVSPGRRGMDLSTLLSTGAQKTPDGRIEGPFSPAVNLPGLAGEVAKDEVVEPLARKAVELAQKQGVETVSSGYDQDRRVGWALGRDKDGKTVRVEAVPDLGLEEAPGWLRSNHTQGGAAGPVVASPDEGGAPEWLRRAPPAPAAAPAPAPAPAAPAPAPGPAAPAEPSKRAPPTPEQRARIDEALRAGLTSIDFTLFEDGRVPSIEELRASEKKSSDESDRKRNAVPVDLKRKILKNLGIPSQDLLGQPDESDEGVHNTFAPFQDTADSPEKGEALLGLTYVSLVNSMLERRKSSTRYDPNNPEDVEAARDIIESIRQSEEYAYQQNKTSADIVRYGAAPLKGLTAGALDLAKVQTNVPFEHVERARAEAGFWGRLTETGLELGGALLPIKALAGPLNIGLRAAGASEAAAATIAGAASLSIYSGVQAGIAGQPVPKAMVEGALMSLIAGPVGERVSKLLGPGTPERVRNLVGEALGFAVADAAIHGRDVTLDDLARSAILGGLLGLSKPVKPAAKPVVKTPDAKEQLTGVPSTDPSRVSELSPGEKAAAPAPDPLAPVSAPAQIPQVQVSDAPAAGFRGEPVGVHTVINKVAEIVNAPLRLGRTGQDAGTWNPEAQVARIRSAQDISAAVHETGHAVIDNVLPDLTAAPTYKQMRAEMLDLGKALYGSTRPAGGYAKEGWAEFFRKWIAEPDTVAKDAPFLSKWFESVLAGNEALRKGVDAARDATTQYRTQGKINLVGSMLQGEGETSRPSVLRRVADFLGVGPSFLKKWVDAGAVFDKLAKEAEATLGGELRPSFNPYKVFTYLNKLAGARVSRFVQRGVTDFAGNPAGPSLSQAKAAARGGGTGKGLSISPETDLRISGLSGGARTRALDSLFTRYLYARHALDVWAAGESGAKRLGPGGPGIDKATAEYTFQALDSPRFQEAARILREYSDGVLNYVVQSGALSAEQVAQMRQLYPNHIPLQRVLNDFAQDVQGQGKGGGGPLHTLRGSGRRVRDPWQTMLEQTEKWIDFAHKHALAQAVERLKNVPGLGKWIEEVSPGMLPHEIPLERVKSQLKKLGIDLDGVDLDQVLMHFETDYSAKPNEAVLPIRGADGKTRFYRLDPELYQALGEIDVYRLHPAVDFFFGAPKRLFTLGTTGLNLGFSFLTNIMRDLPTALMQSKTLQTTNMGELTKGATKLTTAIARSMGGGVKKVVTGEGNPATEATDRLGVHMSRLMGTDTDMVRRAAASLGREALPLSQRVGQRVNPFRIITNGRDLLDYVREWFQIPETAMRAGEVERVLKEMGVTPGENLSLDQAISAAIAGKQVTVDFSAVGTAAKWWNAVTPFFNAGIQGARSMGRTMKENPKAALLKGFLGITVPSLLLWWKNKDEEWYREMPWSERFTYWHTDTGREVLRIPKNHEWSNLFANLPEAILQAIHDQDPRAAEEIIRHLSKTAPGFTGVPLGVATDGVQGGAERLLEQAPQSAQVVGEQLMNKEVYRDSPIVSRGLSEGKESREEYDAYTMRLAKLLGDAFNLSPKRLEHALQGLFGSVPKGIETSMDTLTGTRDRETEPADFPVLGRLFRRGGKEPSRSITVEDFYDQHEALKDRDSSKTNPLSTEERRRLAYGEAASGVLRLLRDRAKDEPSRGRREEINRRMRAVAAWAMGETPDKTPFPKVDDLLGR